MSTIRITFALAVASTWAATVSAQPISLAFKPVDVQYSKSLDRLIMISANPNKVHVVNPITGVETSINLSLVPLSLSVSPDGTHAAVGHDGWIAYVNLSVGYVEKNIAISATANTVILAANGNVWVPPSSTVNIATGAQNPSGSEIYGESHPALHPNGYWIYNTDDGTSPNILGKGDMSSGIYQFLYTYPYWGDFASCGSIFYSADGGRLLTGCGTLFRTTASKSDDMTYSGALSAAAAVASASDSSVAHKFVVVPGNNYNSATADTEIQFYDDSYLTLLGRVALPKYSPSAPWHGRNVFYSPDAAKLYLVLQADASAQLTNDYAIYNLTLSSGSGCNPSLAGNSTDVPAAGESVNVMVTATGGCVWQASSNSTWLNVGAGGVSSGSGTVTIQAGPNLQTVSRVGTITIAGLTYTVTQDAAASAGVNPVTTSPVRPVAADYSAALDRMILVSTNPDVLTILDVATGNSQTVALVMPPTALSISPDGRHAAVGHDGLISYVNLTVPGVEKTLPVTTTVYALALSATDIFAFPLHDQWEAIRVVNIASGAETLWNWVYAGSTAGKISPNGKYLYINAVKRYDVTQPLPSAFDAISNYNPLEWFSQDGSRLFSGSGQVYRLSDVASQDLQYNGTIASGGVSAVADSSVQHVTAAVTTGSSNDKVVNFFAQQYLAPVGSISFPKFTAGGNSYDAHGRYLFWNAAGSKLFAIVQADPTSGFLNDYAIYTVSFQGGCHTSLGSSTASAPVAGGNFTIGVTADAGCAWSASSNTSWLNISGNAFSAGSATVSYIVDPNPTTSTRTATLTVDGKTLTVTQAGGSQTMLSAVNGLLFRVADADYSYSLDRIVALSGSPSRLNIYDPATGNNMEVALPLPGNAVSVAPSGLKAAVCQDGLVSVVNLQTATIDKNLSVSVNCYDIVLADNGYVYLSITGGWGSSDSVNIATGVETKLDLYYDGETFQLNATGDAIYTSGTGTSAASVTRYSISGGPMTEAYQSDWYPAHPFGYKLWFTRDGRMVGDSGSVFRTGSTLATDFIYTGTLSAYGPSLGSIGTLAHSTTRHLFASVGTSSSTNSDTNLLLHGDEYLALASKVALPKITVGGISASSHGKFVFWDSTGTKAYVILQADPSAGFLNDFAVYTLSPDFTPGCAVSLGISSANAIAYSDTGSVAVTADASCVWEVKTTAPWIHIDSGTLGVGIGNVSYSVLSNSGAAPRTGTITIGTQTFTITQAAGGGVALGFFTITPCRAVDTRPGQNKSGPFGPPALVASAERQFPLLTSNCGIPGSAQAYSLNFTAVPPGRLDWLSVWPSGQSYPGASTLNSTDGSTLANAAIVPAGTNGAISVNAGNATDLIIDANGYFAPPNGNDLAFYPITPCRVADTRASQPFSGDFGPPSLASGTVRDFPIQSSPCHLPSTAAAYSLNVTAVPQGALPYLSAWPTGQPYPNVSTLNSSDGNIIANGAIVPAGAPYGSVRVLSGGNTDLIIDVNGYFAPAFGPNALHFYAVTPCRVADTRGSQPFTGAFGPPSLVANGMRDFPITSSPCGVPDTAQAYSLNMTVVPQGPVPYVSVWPAGQPYPNVSTLNSPKGTTLANAAIVPAGTNGSITVLSAGATDLIIDVNGYFAP